MKFAMWLGIALLVSTWLYPPWDLHSTQSAYRGYEGHAVLWRYEDHGYVTHHISWGRLLLSNAVIVVVTAGAMASCRKR